MARPQGLRCSRPGLQAVLRAHRLGLSEAAVAWKIPLTTLSGLAQGDHGASMPTVRKIEDAVGEDDAAAVFPQLAGFRPPATREERERDVA